MNRSELLSAGSIRVVGFAGSAVGGTVGLDAASANGVEGLDLNGKSLVNATSLLASR